MTHCPICEESLHIAAFSCPACQTEYGGKFYFPRLARLTAEERKLSEALILHGGSLKEMAAALEISYPTLKKRLAELSASLKEKQKEDEVYMEQIFSEIEAGKINAKEGIRMIREINGEL